MSKSLIRDYLRKVQKIKEYGGSKNESSIRVAFQNLLDAYANTKELIIVPEVAFKTGQGKTVYPDGTLKDSLRQDWGYWESKDEYDDLELEIEKKLEKGYPNNNILFEDSSTAVLFQGGKETLRAEFANVDDLDELITRFVEYERPEVRTFREAINKFKEDIPNVVDALRQIILSEGQENSDFQSARDEFKILCSQNIDPNISIDDVREMIIQHILTEEIFNTIFDEVQYHQENSIAQTLRSVSATFFKGQLKRQTLQGISHYYKAIKAAAASIVDHHEKQKFLKVLYEAFYQSYNPKAADRLGVVYTPNEIVDFMIEGCEQLMEEHFQKFLEHENVHILDPAVGTGTYICELIDFFPKDVLEKKYRNELHSNEVAILPYYISNLNIEYTYAQKMESYVEFTKHCFVDTLDKMITGNRSVQRELFDPISEENSERIRNQNSTEISVVIGNPPYNSNQVSENDNNKNREYPHIDKRIKETFVKKSTAQKTKVYDMYARFYRWAMDRVNDKGIIAYVTNRSFINKRTFDGFRKSIQDEFDYAYILDLHGDVRANPKISGTSHNVFGIQTGVAITFLVRNKEADKHKCKIKYFEIDDTWTRKERLDWLTYNFLNEINFKSIIPDKNSNWLDISDNDFETLIPICDKDVKSGKGEEAIFKMFTNGVVTNRDEWVYDFSEENLQNKMEHFVEEYNKCVDSKEFEDTIKWSESLKRKVAAEQKSEFDSSLIVDVQFRPFVVKKLYCDKIFSDRLTENHFSIFGANLSQEGPCINFLSKESSHLLAALASNSLVDLCYLKQGNGGTQCLPLSILDKDGSKVSNITDWAERKFQREYSDNSISKVDIFYYVYAILNYPTYTNKYSAELKREFPRIPFYQDFKKWRNIGEELYLLHTESFDDYKSEIEIKTEENVKSNKIVLRSKSDKGVIEIDSITTIHNVPNTAWDYKIAGRSAIDWVLDQFKYKKPRDKNIREKFDQYDLQDYKIELIEKLRKVVFISVESINIISKM